MTTKTVFADLSRTDKEIEEAAKFTDEELEFINKISYSAFEKEDYRPYVLIAICGSILANVLSMSDGQTNKETVMKFLEMAMHEDNLDKPEV